jgi:hypothetical protein
VSVSLRARSALMRAASSAARLRFRRGVIRPESAVSGGGSWVGVGRSAVVVLPLGEVQMTVPMGIFLRYPRSAAADAILTVMRAADAVEANRHPAEVAVLCRRAISWDTGQEPDAAGPERLQRVVTDRLRNTSRKRL